MENKYWYMAAGVILAILWFRGSKVKKALADVMTSSPPASGYAGPEASAQGGQDTSQNHILAQRRFSPPAAGAFRYGQQASGGSNVQMEQGLAPPGSIGTRKRRY